MSGTKEDTEDQALRGRKRRFGLVIRAHKTDHVQPIKFALKTFVWIEQDHLPEVENNELALQKVPGG